MTARTRKPPTLEDVAREARVSLKTASRVLNGAINVRQEKADRVRAVMERIGYRPNELARSLMTRKSSVIGMIVANLANPFITSVIHEVQEVARSHGYVAIVTSSKGRPDIERMEIETLVRRRIDGLILAPAESRRDTITDALPNDLPLVTLDQLVRGASFDSVTITNRRSACDATQHLLGHGYRRIVAIGTRPHLYTSKERITGYRESMRRASFEPRVCCVDHEDLLTSEWFDKEVIRGQSADAVLSLNWVTTLHFLRGLDALGIRGGRNIPFIAFDDFDLGDVLSPRLTVVRQPSELLGRESAQLLFDRMNGKRRPKPDAVVLPAGLIIRESCGCKGSRSSS
ncbi:LacI family transcriptional regulator [Edaphobacter acidisoli]|uniref:LacI family transcriptional regulator n=1 Tax=Edaphobacter acidisoli TaxID=2040573 RepID=A0A916RVH2_9BACT|nr:LacI family DNA-binding transcriptional regulator [Edaphobacter acidisoli]GGA73098.1 LacI family transcriptional regulator [Edaphobacter acidisoli]